MSRSGIGAVDRRTFVKDAALAAAATSGLTSGFGALNGLLAQPRLSGPSRLVVATGQARPFNMVCLGDSIMWGQGLRDSTKFTYQVQSWLERQLPGRTVNRYVFARSGATIAPDSEIPDISRVEDWMRNPGLGEVPCSWPWVREQVTIARDSLSSRLSASAVDLVLMDGGANDIGITTLLDVTQTPAGVRQKTTEKVAGPMADLLLRARNTFPNAKILVTGYYPIVSESSDLAAIGMLLAVVLSAASPFVASLPLPLAAAPLTAEARRILTGLSTAWYDASNADLGNVVAAFNSRWAWASNPAYPTPPAAFAKVPWGQDHTYAAPSTRLWLVGLPEDEVYFERAGACRDAGQAENAKCREAKMGHPNPAGAAAYAAACQAQLAQYLAEWRAEKVMSACVEMDPMPSLGVPTTLTVHATADGPTGRMTVPATVRVGSQTFATDQAVPVTLCSKKTLTSVDKTGLKPERERTTTTSCAPLTVSAPGYVDVVITNYLKAQPLPR